MLCMFQIVALKGLKEQLKCFIGVDLIFNCP